MKDKILKVGLAIALIVIWGTIISRIINGNSDEDGIIIASKSEILTSEKNIKPFQLLVNYSDPFLSNYLVKEAVDNMVDSSLLVLPEVEQKPKKYVRFPLVEYQGMSKNNQRYQSVALVKIDRKTHLVEVGTLVGEIKVIEIYKDSIKVEKEGTYKTYKKGIKK